MRRILPLTALLLAFLAGCSNGEGGTTISEPPAPGPSDTIVVFERSGGLAGVHQRLDVRPDGAARLETGVSDVQVRRFRLSKGELDRLRAARERVDFASLERRYEPDQTIYDGVASTIRADGYEVTVLTEGGPPPELADLIAACGQIVEAHA
jgi:hypothetical protein